jgi:peptidoglycan hydrolase-like protein with peptidoglycan-binding domain
MSKDSDFAKIVGKLLRKLDYDLPKINSNNKAMQAALKDFQTKHGLKVTGTATPETFTLLKDPPPLRLSPQEEARLTPDLPFSDDMDAPRHTPSRRRAAEYSISEDLPFSNDMDAPGVDADPAEAERVRALAQAARDEAYLGGSRHRQLTGEEIPDNTGPDFDAMDREPLINPEGLHTDNDWGDEQLRKQLREQYGTVDGNKRAADLIARRNAARHRRDLERAGVHGSLQDAMEEKAQKFRDSLIDLTPAGLPPTPTLKDALEEKAQKYRDALPPTLKDALEEKAQKYRDALADPANDWPAPVSPPAGTLIPGPAANPDFSEGYSPPPAPELSRHERAVAEGQAKSLAIEEGLDEAKRRRDDDFERRGLDMPEYIPGDEVRAAHDRAAQEMQSKLENFRPSALDEDRQSFENKSSIDLIADSLNIDLAEEAATAKSVREAQKASQAIAKRFDEANQYFNKPNQ